MSRIIFIAGILIAAAPYPTVSASTTTPLGWQQTKAFGLLDTKALVVGKLVKRVETQDAAYVVFENLRVVRGKEASKLLVFNHPEPTDHTGIIFHRILERDVDSLKEGELFLVTVGKGYLPPLTRWVPLTNENQEAVIAQELKPYQELDENLKRDPWKAVEDEDLFVQACALCFYYRYATPDEVEKLLAEFAEKDQQPRMRFLLVWQALEHLAEKNDPLEPELLVRVFRVEIDDEKWAGIRSRIQSLAVRRFENAQPSEHDKLIVEAVNSTNRDVRLAALHVLCRRKIPGCLTGIRKALAGIPSMFEPAYERNLAAKALRFQIGRRSVDEVLRHCQKGPDRNEQLRMSFDFLAEGVEMEHIEILRSLDDPEHREIHARVTELLVYAGDKEAPTEYFRLVKNWTIKRLPYDGDPRLLQHAASWRESAKWFLANRKCADGASFISCAEVLLHLRDSELGKLILPMVKDDHFHHWALRYLVFIADETYRPVFEKYTNDKKAQMRAFAWAGLAQLGDKQGLLKVAELTALAPDGMTRYYLSKHVLPRIEIAAVRKAWESERPTKQDAVEIAVHEFVLEQLKGK